MEPLRPLVDSYVLDLDEPLFTKENKHRIANLLNTIVRMDGRDEYLLYAMRSYVKSVTDSLDSENMNIRFCEYEI